jgi:hypothetical protein
MSSIGSNRLDVGLGSILDVGMGILQKTIDGCGEGWLPGPLLPRIGLRFVLVSSSTFLSMNTQLPR